MGQAVDSTVMEAGLRIMEETRAAAEKINERLFKISCFSFLGAVAVVTAAAGCTVLVLRRSR